MLYLSHPSNENLNKYFSKIKDVIANNINDTSKNKFLNHEAKEFLLKNLEKIIKSEPVELKKLNFLFFQKLNKGILTPNRYVSYIKYLNIKEKNRSIYQKLFIRVYKRQLKNLEEIFDYEKIISKSKHKSYWLSKKINTNTCIYCNRLYANVIEIDNGSNDDKRIARPFFDHWYAKSKYPILALSFYNLIPSCSVCNSSIKGSLDFDIETHIHPYIKDSKNDFKFSYKHQSLSAHNVTIRDFESLSDKARKTIEDFKIREVFDVHSDKELKDLLDLKYKYSNNYIIELFKNTFDNLEVSEDEIYRMVFGIETKEEDYHKRPFSKFKKDIIDELLKK